MATVQARLYHGFTSNTKDCSVLSQGHSHQKLSIDLFDMVQSQFEQGQDYKKLKCQGLPVDWFSRSAAIMHTYWNQLI